MSAAARPPSFHPGEDLVLAYAAGALGPAPSLLVATHASVCPSCTSDLAALEEAGGAMLSSLEPAPLAPSLRDSVLARLDSMPAKPPARPAPPEKVKLPGYDLVLPEPLASWVRADAASLAWRWIFPGVRQLTLPVAWGDVPVRLVRFSRGIFIPRHTHSGRELTLVLDGELSDSIGSYGTGDVSDYDSTVVHRQTVTSRDACFCLVVNEGHPVTRSLLGRVVARFTDA